ncbi:membrane-associated lipoprotein involved in thiamine biosynthesis [Hoeflea sp. IMCC20628]|uniref:FAD:protein FMN transferase n=1 Tax=Hoeflea sp. IMCC20628 TaxID=1620421 RepID=UPI00063AC7DA|nr:FAD:protein FMN transferase [Hoeflea sp. IMCC20628]AKI01955.1 membrane-associated lipoprotein involved in thiamine biosynthesis [Hoeflea sp. IMCC20628]
MTISRRRFIGITAGCMLTANSAFSASFPGARWQGVALGAHADLRLVGLPSREAEELLAVARAEIERLEQIFSLYRTDSALARLNATGALHQPEADMVELMSLVSAIHQASGGLFDPSVQPLWMAYARAGGAPDREVIKAARAMVGWSKVRISLDRIELAPGGSLTLNGIAQGFITDRIVKLLVSNGLEAGLVSVGEIAAVGGSPVGGDWPVGLADHEDGQPDATVYLRDKAVATSSATGTMFGAGQAGHILNPVTGLPATSAWRRVSIIHSSAAIADGLSTAGVMLNSAALRDLALQFPGASVRAVDQSGHELIV